MPVYLIQAGDDGPCKIGHAKNVAKRRAELQCATHVRLRLVAVYEGGEPQERVLHELFRADRLGGEWFNLRLPDALEAITIALAPIRKRKAPSEERPLTDDGRPYLAALQEDRRLRVAHYDMIAPTATVSQFVELYRFSNARVRKSDEDEVGFEVLMQPKWHKPPPTPPLFEGPLLHRSFVIRPMGSA